MSDDLQHEESQLAQLARISFANQLKEARLATLADGESFTEILFAVERLGAYLDREKVSAPQANKAGKKNNRQFGTLGTYKKSICAFVAAVSEKCRNNIRQSHCCGSFNSLYERITQSRNDALHQGAVARNLANDCVKLAILLEDALRMGSTTLSDYMVHNPTCAELWHIMSYIRQQMLSCSYSVLPVYHDGKWKLLTDCAVFRWLRFDRNSAEVNKRVRSQRKHSTLQEAIDCAEDPIGLKVTEPRQPDCPLTDALDDLCKGAALIVAPENSERLIGIVTPFDLL